MDASIPNIHIMQITLIILLAVMLQLQTVYASNQKLELSSAENITENIANQSPDTTQDLMQDAIQDPTMPKVSLTNNATDSNADNAANAADDNSLQLSMIKISDNERTAIINEQTVREQDVIGTYQVIKIEPNKVTLKTLKPNKNNRINKGIKDNKELFTELRLPTVTIKEQV
jgi:hypothetical protein